MSVAHIKFDRDSQHGRMIDRSLSQIEEGRAGLVDVLGILANMIDGSPGTAASYTYMTTMCGFVDNAGAMAAYNELTSLKIKLTTDASQTDVSNAITQARAKLG